MPNIVDICHKMVILIQLLDMHGNFESFTELCPLIATQAVAWRKGQGKEQNHLGNNLA